MTECLKCGSHRIAGPYYQRGVATESGLGICTRGADTQKTIRAKTGSTLPAKPMIKWWY